MGAAVAGLSSGGRVATAEGLAGSACPSRLDRFGGAGYARQIRRFPRLKTCIGKRWRGASAHPTDKIDLPLIGAKRHDHGHGAFLGPELPPVLLISFPGPVRDRPFGICGICGICRAPKGGRKIGGRQQHFLPGQLASRDGPDRAIERRRFRYRAARPLPGAEPDISALERQDGSGRFLKGRAEIQAAGGYARASGGRIVEPAIFGRELDRAGQGQPQDGQGRADPPSLVAPVRGDPALRPGGAPCLQAS